MACCDTPNQAPILMHLPPLGNRRTRPEFCGVLVEGFDRVIGTEAEWRLRAVPHNTGAQVAWGTRAPDGPDDTRGPGRPFRNRWVRLRRKEFRSWCTSIIPVR